jgi:methylenetetrahydrofolate reductase (NADPH)
MNKGKYLNGEGINTDFGIAVAAYPETHPDAKSPIHDLQNLKHKLEKADFAITQLFFDMEKYESFIENAAKIGIIKPIVPGIMVLETYSQLARFEKMNISVPLNMKNEIERFKEDARVVKEIGSSYAAKNCSQLMKYAPGLHFYTMNRHAHVRDVFRKIF